MHVTSPAPHRNARAASSLYRHVGVETGIAVASPHRLIAMLFEGLRESLAEARCAIHGGQIEAKGRAIGRAVRIVEEGLKAGLNLEQGGGLAQDLHALYAYVTLTLTRANLHGDAAAIDECQRLIDPLVSAWAQIAPREAEAPR